MYRYEILESVDPISWNNELTNCKCSTFFQTFEYLMSESELGNTIPIFIKIYDESENLSGQLGLIVNMSSRAYSSKHLSKIQNFFAHLQRRATWVSGPIIHETDKRKRIQILNTFIKSLENLSEKYNLALINGYTPPQDFLIDNEFQNEFINNGYNIQNFFTFAIDLNRSLDDIWNNIHNSTQRDVKKAQKNKIFVKELSKFPELEEHFNLVNKWSKTKGITPQIPNDYKKKYWNSIESNIEKIFLSFQDDELLASHRLGCFNGIAYSHRITNSYSKPTNLGGPILTWHAIEWAKKNGMKIYDFSGGESPPTDEKDKKRYFEQWESLLTFKRKWGGSEFPYFHLIKVRNKQSYKISRIISKLDWIFRDYKKKHYKKPIALK